MEKTGIFCKLDYFQAVFDDVDFNYVVNDFLEMDVTFTDDVFNSAYERQYGYDSHLVFNIGPVQISAKYDQVICAGDSVFSSVYSKVFLIVPGQALDFLRSYYDSPEEVDRILRKPPELDKLGQPKWRVTRADFAFDFVNYKFDIYDTAAWELRKCATEQGTVKVKGLKRPISFSIRSGSEKTIYLGKGRSDRLLRIYDKKLQLTKDGQLIELPDDSIDYDIVSWDRIELQCRNNWAYHYLYHSEDFIQVLREIYEYYSFIDKDGNVTDFWKSLFDWQSIPAIIQNAYFEKQPLSREVLDRQYDVGKQVIAAFMAFYGKEYVYRDLESEFYKLFHDDGVRTSRRRLRLLRRINCLNDFKNDNTHLLGAASVCRSGKNILVLK